MTSADPDQLRRDIDRTRERLSTRVDTLAHEANPSTIARRKVRGVTGTLGSVRDRVMGSAQDTAQSASESADSAASSITDAVRSAPDAVQQRTQGSPLAAGLIAFGAGLLVSAMFPPTQAEQQAAATLQEKAQPLADQVSSAAQDVAGSLQESASQAVDSVKETATDAAQTVKEEGTSAAQETSTQAKHAADTVADEAR
ncbi:DUF3618 domain-containing protein [Williamsia deligens]|uniref:DUF3618 domain-containing protein n=1 Tax=Williamsia deligens TaxID=321325 RepID=A0ABW3G3I5_9NOCA|nr:DUF3618 domain-containing protein [Williamsia deligens]MCP2194481.1 Protein of unknown function (DUF3618) [Williamsia deligens]